MKSLKALWYVFYKSLTSPQYYKDLLTVPTSFTMKYFFVLALLASAITAPFVYKEIKPDVTKFSNELSYALPDAFPQDLVLTVAGGEFSINQPEPYFVPFPENDDGIENFVVIDSAGTIEDLEKYKTLALINKTNMITYDDGGTLRVYPISDFPDGSFGYNEYSSLVNEFTPFIEMLPEFVGWMVFVAVLLKNTIFRLIYFVFVAAFVSLIGSARGLKLDYSKYYQFVVHASTLAIFVEVLAVVAGYSIGVPMWFLALNLVMAFAGLWAVEKS